MSKDFRTPVSTLKIILVLFDKNKWWKIKIYNQNCGVGCLFYLPLSSTI